MFDRAQNTHLGKTKGKKVMRLSVVFLTSLFEIHNFQLIGKNQVVSKLGILWSFKTYNFKLLF